MRGFRFLSSYPRASPLMASAFGRRRVGTADPETPPPNSISANEKKNSGTQVVCLALEKPSNPHVFLAVAFLPRPRPPPKLLSDNRKYGTAPVRCDAQGLK